MWAFIQENIVLAFDSSSLQQSFPVSSSSMHCERRRVRQRRSWAFRVAEEIMRRTGKSYIKARLKLRSKQKNRQMLFIEKD